MNDALQFTDDLTLHVADDETLDSLVDYLLESEQLETPWQAQLSVLTDRFALSFDDARLALDRVHGGRVRAGNPLNEPNKAKDPVAWIAYHRALGAPFVRTAGRSVAWSGLLEDATKGDGADARNRISSAAFQTQVRAPEKMAASLWLDAYHEVGEYQGSTDVGVAVRLFELGAATLASNCPVATKTRILLQLATSLSSAAEGRIADLGSETCAQQGSQAWIDAACLAGSSQRLAPTGAQVVDELNCALCAHVSDAGGGMTSDEAPALRDARSRSCNVERRVRLGGMLSYYHREAA